MGLACVCSIYIYKSHIQITLDKVRVLLPHELLDVLASMECHHIFDAIMLGHMDRDSRVGFWQHVRKLPGWEKHPVFGRHDLDLGMVVPICVHGDGAAMRRDDEYFTWSFSSLFGSLGKVKDVLLFKFPFAIVAERHMRSANVPGLILIHLNFCVCIPSTTCQFSMSIIS